MSVREGIIPKPKASQQVYTKYVTVRNKKMIMTFHESDTSITIYIGNSRIYCIDVQLLKKVNGEFYDQGHLTKIRWDRVCSLNDNFEKGTDSVMILKLILTYIFNTYPIKSMTFTDLSTKECDDGSKINLAALKYLTVGKTWYEDNFGASIDESSSVFYSSLLKQLTTKKLNTTWEQLRGYIPMKSIPIEESKLQELYEKAGTWQEFFNPILQELGKSRLCKIFSPWFDTFVMGFLRMNYISLVYVLPIKDYGIRYTLSDYPQGGMRSKGKSRRTRKV